MADLSVKLLAHTDDPERAVAAAARLCYSPRGVSELHEKLTEEEVASLLEKLVGMGHFSALEHAVFTFGVEGISRACSHQLVRHRLASYSQQSQRYVTLGEPVAIIPETVKADKAACEEFDAMLESLWALYSKLVEGGVPPEDARYILPNACETKIVVTMNARELRHFFRLRLCRRAQWEIRDMAVEMLRVVGPAAPKLFAGTGPGCVEGPCPEGAYTCGKPEAVRKEIAEIF